MPRAMLIAGSTLLGVVLSVLLNITFQPSPLKDDMTGIPPGVDQSYLDPLQLGYGFYDPETAPDGNAYRWTGPHATRTFPYAANLGRYADVSVRVSVYRVAGETPPVAKLYLNNQLSATFVVTGDFEAHMAKLDTEQAPNPYLDPAHVQIDLETPTFVNKGNPRQLGVAVDWIELQPERGWLEIVLEGAVWALALAVILLIATRRLTARWSLVYGLGALVSFAAIHLTPMPRAFPVGVEIALAGLAWLVAALLAPKERPVWGLGLAACGLWLVVAGRVLGDWQMDDAYISYRYAWNFVHGHGLVYNPGEVVEGYTNFLWTMFAAGAIVLGFAPAGVALATNIALSIGIVGITFHIGGKLSGGVYVWPMLAAVFLSLDVALITYGARGSGMESAAFAFFVILALALLWDRADERSTALRVLGGLSLALASLARPEGLLVVGLLLVVRAAQDRRASGMRYSNKMLVASLAPYLAVYLPYQAWRISFYGYLFPNTFYAKTGATSALIERGLSHLSFFWGDHWLMATLAVAGLVVSVLREQRRALHAALAAIVVAYTLYIIWVGGDYFPGWRFFVPIIAPIVLLAQEGVRIGLGYLPSARPVRAGAVLALAVVAMPYLRDTIALEEANGWLDLQTRLHTTYISRWGSAGLWLRDNTPPETWTIAKGAGAIAYYSQRRAIDIFGLNDLHIAHLPLATIGEGKAGHEKEDPQYVLDRRPDYILAEWDANFQSVKAQLRRDYEYLKVRGPIGKEIEWWKRK